MCAGAGAWVSVVSDFFLFCVLFGSPFLKIELRSLVLLACFPIPALTFGVAVQIIQLASTPQRGALPWLPTARLQSGTERLSEPLLADPG